MVLTTDYCVVVVACVVKLSVSLNRLVGREMQHLKSHPCLKDAGNVLSISGRSFVWLLLLFAFGNAQLNMQIRDEESGDPIWTKPRIMIQNLSPDTLNFATLRYYFHTDQNQNPFVQVLEPYNQSALVIMEQDQGYVEIDLGYESIAPGKNWRWGNGVLFSIRYEDFSVWDGEDDWSQAPLDGSTLSTTHITLHDHFGHLLWGEAPPSFSSLSDTSFASEETEVVPWEVPDCWFDFAALTENQTILDDYSKILGSGLVTYGVPQLGAYVQIEGSVWMALDSSSDRDSMVWGENLAISGDILSQTPWTQQCPVANSEWAVNVVDEPAWVVEHSMALSPAVYGRLVVDSGVVVVLDTGTYKLQSLTLRHDARVEIRAPQKGKTQVVVAGSVSLQKNSRFECSQDSCDIELIVLGADVDIQENVVGEGLLAAPRGNIFLGSDSQWFGSLVAHNLHLASRASLFYANPGLVKQNVSSSGSYKEK